MTAVLGVVGGLITLSLFILNRYFSDKAAKQKAEAAIAAKAAAEAAAIAAEQAKQTGLSQGAGAGWDAADASSKVPPS